MRAPDLFVRTMRVLGCAMAMALWIGCGGPERPGPQPVPTSATITFNGQPVEGATVTFSPTDPSGKAASGTTDKEGNVKLTTYEPGDGALPGSYKVLVSKMEVIGGATGEEGEEEESDEEARYRSLLPQRYNSLTETDLTAQVTEDGENHFTFELKP